LNFITANGVESTLFYYGNGVGGSTFSKVSVNTDSAYLAVQNAGSSYSTIAAYSNGSYLSNDTSANNSLVVIDEISYKGLIYKDDYSSNFTTYSLVTKGYVDTQVGTSTSKYATIVSFTASVTQTITHSLGTDEIIVQAYDSTGVMVIPGIVQINGTNDVDITFSSTLSSIKIIVIG
jgi:hypothetical protein